MENTLMNLKILLPFRVFSEVKNVTRIVAETSGGSYGFLPQRLDCVAAIVPGIFVYETAESGVKYLALDEGVMIKSGLDVMVSVRNAVSGVDLGQLHESVEKEFKKVEDTKNSNRAMTTKLESELMYTLQQFRKE